MYCFSVKSTVLMNTVNFWSSQWHRTTANLYCKSIYNKQFDKNDTNLQQKIKSRNLTLNWFDYDNHQWFYERECKRLDCLNSWLDKINEKYNYI